MKFLIALFPAAFIFIGALSGQSSLPEIEAGKVIIQLHPDAVSNVETQLKSLKKTSSDTPALRVGVKSIDDVNLKYGATAMKRVFPDAGKYEAKHRKYELHLWYEIDIPESEDPETVAAAYRSGGSVRIAEPRYKIRRAAASPLPPVEIPNDPSFAKQWGYRNTGQSDGTPGVDVRLPEARERAVTFGIRNRNVIVAVVDGGVYYDHEDLKANMWVNEAEANGTARVDDDGNGYIDDVHGYNFVSLTGGTIVPEDHATHVAGIVAAVTGNETGVSGMAGNMAGSGGVKIMNIEIMSGDRSTSSIGPAYTYAADNGAVISQNSWGYEQAGKYNPSDVAAINYFISEAGRDENGNPRPGTPMVGGIVIFAAGNDGRDAGWYPAYFDNVLAVAAVDHNGKRTSYSNYGSWVDISAPGGEGDSRKTDNPGGIYSTSYRTTNKNYYEYMWGTSMACPHVSGAAALILSVYGYEGFTPDMLRYRLLTSAASLAGYDPDYASGAGAGLLNACEALAADCAPQAPTVLSAEGTGAVSGRLEWTVPGTPGNCPARGYLTACDTVVITEENFNSRLNVSGPVTASAGETMSADVRGLLPGKTWYAAVRHVGPRGDASPMLASASFTTCPNDAPVIVRPIPDVTIRDVSPEKGYFAGDVFADGDGDAITRTVITADGDIARVSIDGDSIRIRPYRAGETTLTFTADDGNTGRATCTFALTVTGNSAPTIDGLPEIGPLIPYASPVVVDLSRYTVDMQGDAYSFSYRLDQTGVVDVALTGNTLTVDPRHHGTAVLTLTAADRYAARSTTTIDITVERKYASDVPDNLLVYPNPVVDNILRYSFVLSEEASADVRLVNAVGATVYRNTADRLAPGTHHYEVNLADHPPGMYFLQYLKNGRKTDTKKIIKQ